MMKHTQHKQKSQLVARVAVDKRTHKLVRWLSDETGHEMNQLIWDSIRLWARAKNFDSDKILGEKEPV